MLVFKHLEPSVNGVVLLITGTDSAGNDLAADVELFVKLDGTSLPSVDALVSLLEMVDDLRVIGGDRQLKNGTWYLPEELRDANKQRI